MAPVFDKNNLTSTRTSVPEAGNDNHVPVAGDYASWSSKKSGEFVKDSDGGQKQNLIKTADEILKIQKNQKTTVTQKITIESETSEIEVKADTKITLEVGASKLVMDAEGNITLSGKVIKILGRTSTDISAPNNHIEGTTKMDGGDVFIN